MATPTSGRRSAHPHLHRAPLPQHATKRKSRFPIRRSNSMHSDVLLGYQQTSGGVRAIHPGRRAGASVTGGREVPNALRPGRPRTARCGCARWRIPGWLPAAPSVPRCGCRGARKCNTTVSPCSTVRWTSKLWLENAASRNRIAREHSVGRRKTASVQLCGAQRSGDRSTPPGLALAALHAMHTCEADDGECAVAAPPPPTTRQPYRLLTDPGKVTRVIGPGLGLDCHRHTGGSDRHRVDVSPALPFLDQATVPDGPGSVRYRAELQPFACPLSRDWSVIGPVCQPYLRIWRICWRSADTATGIRNGPRASRETRLCLQIDTFAIRPNHPHGARNRPKLGVNCGALVAHSAKSLPAHMV
jgi:hypothetical protein